MNIKLTKIKTKTKANLSNTFFRAVCIVALFLMAMVFIPSNNSLSLAMTDAEYNQQINNLNSQKDATNQNLKVKQGEARTLSSEVATIDKQIAQMQSQVSATQSEIDAVNNQIDTLNNQISEGEAKIKIQKESLNEYLRVIYEDSNTSTIELIAASHSFSDFVDKTEYSLTMQMKIRDTVATIKKLRQDLETQKSGLVQKRQGIEDLKTKQVGQKQGVDAQRAVKNNLLKTTKGQESNYQVQVANLQKEIDSIDAVYTAAKNKGSSGGSTYTGNGNTGNTGGSGGSGNTGQAYLSWPSYGGVYQEWGWTDLANQCFYKYNGQCTIHNGLDISTGSTGNPIKAAADGSVLDTGYGYSGGWGNWVAVQHTGNLNGLVTFYAHMSSIAVSPGQSVSRGQMLGTEGNTGISIGGAVHLHFSVFTNFKLYNCCGYHGPDYSGTVNPRNFLH